eukprot:scaffold120298_cov15-Prasinocladus_malaysianus.AAC.1
MTTSISAQRITVGHHESRLASVSPAINVPFPLATMCYLDGGSCSPAMRWCQRGNTTALKCLDWPTQLST